MNNRNFKLLAGAVACAVTLSSGSVYAEVKAPEKAVAKVQVTGLKEREAASELTSLLADINTLSASFEQQTLDDSGRRLQESKGDMVLKRPNLFRWNVTSPFPQEVVSDGARVSYYDKDLDQLTLQDIDTRTSAAPAVLLSGDAAKMLEGFTVTLSQSGPERFFTLLPKSQDNSFEELQLSFKGKALKEMMLTDTLGSRTRISFLNPRVNQPVKDKLFELSVPPGVDVIDQTSVAFKANSGANTSKP